MALSRFTQFCLVAVCVALAVASFAPTASGYDPLDPTGNITIIWDIPNFTGDGYAVEVSVWNYQFYRKIHGWKVSWSWWNGEYIWGAKGAYAPVQGDCSKIQSPGGSMPHCCLSNPVFVDMDPPKLDDAGKDPPAKNCCKGGYIGCQAQDPDKSLAAFKLTVGNATNTIWSFKPPGNFSIGLDGYTCTEAFRTDASVLPDLANPGTTRKTQSLLTYKVVCTYSKEPVRTPPKCCVSLSAFYNDTIVPCPYCSCACGSYGKKSVICLAGSDQHAYNAPYLTTSGDDGMELMNDPNAMECSPDGCPISVHYHVKTNYKDYWRGKVTVINRQLWKNYTKWNLVLEHPNVANLTDVFSFNALSVQPYGVNNTVVMWGLKQYNVDLHTAGPGGNVQSEMLFAKTPDFTFANGWAFPRKIIFNGEECAMPEEFPALPSAAGRLQLTGAMTVLATLMGLLLLF